MVVRQTLLGDDVKYAASMINSPQALFVAEIHFCAEIHFHAQPLQQTKDRLRDEG